MWGLLLYPITLSKNLPFWTTDPEFAPLHPIDMIVFRWDLFHFKGSLLFSAWANQTHGFVFQNCCCCRCDRIAQVGMPSPGGNATGSQADTQDPAALPCAQRTGFLIDATRNKHMQATEQRKFNFKKKILVKTLPTHTFFDDKSRQTLWQTLECKTTVKHHGEDRSFLIFPIQQGFSLFV